MRFSAWTRVGRWSRGTPARTASRDISKRRSSENISLSFTLPEDIASGNPEEALRIAAQEGRYEEEGWRIRKDGSRFLANVIITALRDEAGHLRGFAKVTGDITERRAAEKARQEAEALKQRTTA